MTVKLSNENMYFLFKLVFTCLTDKMSAVGRAGNQDQDPINRGIRDLLLSLTADDLKAILKTVTNSLVQYGSVPVDGQGKPLTDAKTRKNLTSVSSKERYQ